MLLKFIHQYLMSMAVACVRDHADQIFKGGRTRAILTKHFRLIGVGWHPPLAHMETRSSNIIEIMSTRPSMCIIVLSVSDGGIRERSRIHRLAIRKIYAMTTRFGPFADLSPHGHRRHPLAVGCRWSRSLRKTPLPPCPSSLCAPLRSRPLA